MSQDPRLQLVDDLHALREQTIVRRINERIAQGDVASRDLTLSVCNEPVAQFLDRMIIEAGRL